MSDEDLAVIVAYLRSQPAVANTVPEPAYAFLRTPEPFSPVCDIATPPRDVPVRYGKYLVSLGHCMECHTPRDESTGKRRDDAIGAGGRILLGPWGESLARNLTSHESGLRDWSDAQIATAVQTGIDRDGKPYKLPMGFDFYAGIDDRDMAAVIAFLRSLDPVPLGGPRRFLICCPQGRHRASTSGMARSRPARSSARRGLTSLSRRAIQ